MRIAGCFLEHEGKFLILLRHSYKPKGNTWGLPAGKIENDEDDKRAVLRELREETGYDATAEELHHLGDYEFGSGENKYIFATYKITLDKPYRVTLEKTAHSKFKWVTPEECYKLPNLIPDFHELLELLGLSR